MNSNLAAKMIDSTERDVAERNYNNYGKIKFVSFCNASKNRDLNLAPDINDSSGRGVAEQNYKNYRKIN